MAQDSERNTACCAPVKLSYNTIESENCSKDTPPIIFLHGVTGSKEYWNDIPQIVANETKQKVYVLDARDHGDSEWSDTFHFDYNVVDLLNFMDAHDIPRATLVGHSMGGYTGFKTALQMPETVSKLVVEDMYPQSSPFPKPEMMLKFISLTKAALSQVPLNATEGEAAEFISDFVYTRLPTNMTKTHSKRTAEEIRVLLKRNEDGRFSVKSNFDLIENAMKSTEGIRTDTEGGEFVGPTYLIYGKRSGFSVGENELFTRKFFPNAKFFPIENATHTVHKDCPKEFIEALLKCLLDE